MQIEGITLHAFSGIRKGDDRKDAIVSRACSENYTCRRWRGTDVLLVDEVSMVDGDIFEKVTAHSLP